MADAISPMRMIRDFARDGQIHGGYGDAELTTPLEAVVGVASSDQTQRSGQRSARPSTAS